MREFHDAITQSPNEGKDLKDTLDKIFESLQILPLNPGRPVDAKQLWLWDSAKSGSCSTHCIFNS